MKTSLTSSRHLSWIARLVPVIAALLLTQVSAHAHHLPPGFEEIDEFEHSHAMWVGFQHPLSGWDHCLALLAVGAVAAVWQRRNWILPASLAGGLALGGWLSLHGIATPDRPLLSAAVLFLAAAVMWSSKEAVRWLLASVVLIFGLWQGGHHASWVTLPQILPGYTAGFILASVLIVGAGAGLTLAAQRFFRRSAKWIGAGSAVAALASCIVGCF